jgi:hypothetical protein
MPGDGGGEATVAPNAGEFLSEARPLGAALDKQEIYRLLGLATA